MKAYITVDSFGSECPDNWQEIADWLNELLAIRVHESDDPREVKMKIDTIWDGYWRFYHAGALQEYEPKPVFHGAIDNGAPDRI